jgi:hypothetical protein
MIEEHDSKQMYCRALGHRVPFSYCRKPGKELFCRNILSCWSGTFDVTAYIEEHFTREQIEGALTPPKPKIASLVELIQRAQAAKG